MDVFGRSVDVDGDEWIDLGLPPAPLEVKNTVGGNHKETSSHVTSKAQTSECTTTSEPMPEPEPDTNIKRQQRTCEPQKQQKKVTEPQKPKLPASTKASKAARSKEALMAFYLGRAKQMEAKHMKIVVFPPESVAIRTLQDSAPIGL